MQPAYKRVVIKISGEALAGENGFGISGETISKVAEQIISVVKLGVEVGIVIGAGNIWRGRQGRDMDRSTADHMGMLATVINSLAMQDALEHKGYKTRVMTAIAMNEIAEPYIRRKAMSHLDKKLIVIFACGTGNPFFSTDTTAALRAAEIEADVIFKATMVDGVYDKDPNKYEDAVKYDELTFSDVITRELGVMDSTAAAMCRDNSLPILVFNLNHPENIVAAVKGEPVGTLVHD